MLCQGASDKAAECPLMPAKKSGRRPAGRLITIVPDRSRLSLGSEARIAAKFLRQHGADPSLVPRPGIDTDEARRSWLQKRSPLVRTLPLWAIDLAAAILDQIPIRQERPANRPKDYLTKDAEFWKQTFGMTSAEAARWAVTLDPLHRRSDDDTDLDAKAQKVSRRLYRKPTPKRK